MSNQSLYAWLAGHCRTHVVRSYLEIGTRDGGSLEVVLANARQLSDVVCCDTWGSQFGGSGRGNHAHIHVLMDSIGYDGRRTFLDGDSKVTVPTLLPHLAGTFDLALVDGDHSYAGGMADLVNVWPLLRPGGALVFHDIRHPAHADLAACFADFVNKHTRSHEIITDDYGLGIAWKP